MELQRKTRSYNLTRNVRARFDLVEVGALPVRMDILGSRETVSRQAHNLEIAGSTPASPTRVSDGGFTPRPTRRRVHGFANEPFPVASPDGSLPCFLICATTEVRVLCPARGQPSSRFLLCL